ncbi:putative cytochrome P450 [Nocardia nova SH22a]|uniref:Putative cytochrome P450 n=1 Tax=Nocardia nova SH22a TaxID=1415166 RepID=W5TT86_9NOCA|nr:cytochrome P450 [Nocardia nova]AHH22143.1 putative cytochrome P450 [Nocardia nova SH22a]
MRTSAVRTALGSAERTRCPRHLGADTAAGPSSESVRGSASRWCGFGDWTCVLYPHGKLADGQNDVESVPRGDRLGLSRDDEWVLTVFGGDFARDPWSVFDGLRGEDGGVHRVASPDGPPAWLVTRYDDVRAGLLDDRLATNIRHARGDDYKGFAVPAPMDAFARSDPDQLSRLRRAVTAELHPGRLSTWADRADGLTAQLLGQCDETAEFDLVERVAVPLPAAVLEELLGLPPAVGSGLRRWAESALRPDAGLRARDTLATMHDLVDAAVEYGRRSGDESMLARLTRNGLLDGEQVSLLFYLLFVWYEVLVDLTAGAVAAFAANPGQLEAFLRQPDRSKGVDELIRYLCPQMTAGPRFAVEDMIIGGHRIPAGQTVLLSLASANHDPSVFDSPEKLDVTRRSNPHLGFGLGAHACVGTGLVRPVTAAVLSRIATTWPDLRLVTDPGDIQWRNGFRHRGPLELKVQPS